MGDICYTTNPGDDSGRIVVPRRKITEDKPEYNYRPCRGYGFSLAVEDINDKCIGWIDVRLLGYETVKDWMRAVRYRA